MDEGRLGADIVTMPRASRLQPIEEAVITSVRADPEPSDLVVFQQADGTVSQRHADRVDRVAPVNLFVGLPQNLWVENEPMSRYGRAFRT